MYRQTEKNTVQTVVTEHPNHEKTCEGNMDAFKGTGIYPMSLKHSEYPEKSLQARHKTKSLSSVVMSCHGL